MTVRAVAKEAGPVPRGAFRLAHPEAGPIEALACCLVGGPSQAPATAMAHDLAQSHGASLTAVAAVDPYIRERRSRLKNFCQTVFTNACHDVMRRSAHRAIDDFERQNSDRRVEARRIVRGADWRSLRDAVSGHDLAVAPAWVGIDGLDATPENEVAPALARNAGIPVLRVASLPLDRGKVLFLIDGASQHCRLARVYMNLGLWRTARIVILPIGGGGSSVEVACEERKVLRRHDHNAAVLPPLAADAVPDLEKLTRQFHVAAVDRSLGRSGLFASLRNCAFRAVTSRVPAILFA
ncbi:MAG TPA: hypothetical protein VHN20_00400 [Beijerinckiaceae bacterium]|nr:hypothetical protein [Beijerinckiaceae bacterium]